VKLARSGVARDRLDDESVLYDVVLLAGTPRRLALRLPRDLEAESVIEVDGEQWTVADVRVAGDDPALLICIYAV